MNGDSAIDIVFALLEATFNCIRTNRPAELDFSFGPTAGAAFLENALTNSLYLDTCDGTNKRGLLSDPSKTLHAGSTLCAIDVFKVILPRMR